MLAQSSSGNKSTASNAAGPLTPYSPGPHSNPGINTPFNQSKLFPNNTETIKSFDKLNGNNSQFFTKNNPISNPHNNIGDALQETIIKTTKTFFIHFIIFQIKISFKIRLILLP